MSRLEVMSTRTFSRPAFLTCLAFNPRDLYYRGYYQGYPRYQGSLGILDTEGIK